MPLLTTSRDALLAPLQSVAGIVEKRHTLPILANILIEKQGEQLTMLATDIEIQVRTITSGHGSGDSDNASFTVSARKLLDILRALPDSIDVSFSLKDNRLALCCGKSRFTLQTLPSTDYPRMNLPDSAAPRVTLSQKSFKCQLSQVAYAMAQHDIRYYLNGLLLIIEGGELRLVATDGHRLAYSSSTIESSLPRTEAILPRKAVMELARQLSDSDASLEIVIADNQAVFRFGSTELVSKLIDGKFPDYNRVIPSEHSKHLVFDRLALLSALQRAAILSNDKFRGIRLILENGQLRIISSNSEQEEAQDEIDIDYNDETLDIGFNVSYLIDVLNHLPDDTIEFYFKDSESSALLTLPDNHNFKYVVMPMRI